MEMQLSEALLHSLQLVAEQAEHRRRQGARKDWLAFPAHTYTVSGAAAACAWCDELEKQLRRQEAGQAQLCASVDAASGLMLQEAHRTPQAQAACQ